MAWRHRRPRPGPLRVLIADGLYLSVQTIESYRARLMSKLGLTNRAELTKFALDAGLMGGA